MPSKRQVLELLKRDELLAPEHCARSGLDSSPLNDYPVATGGGHMALMDRRIGVRELKNRATEIIRDVHETDAEYVVTLRGEPVATLRPYRRGQDERVLQAETADSLARLDALAREVAQAWRSPAGALDLLEGQRR